MKLEGLVITARPATHKGPSLKGRRLSHSGLFWLAIRAHIAVLGSRLAFSGTYFPFDLGSSGYTSVMLFRDPLHDLTYIPHYLDAGGFTKWPIMGCYGGSHRAIQGILSGPTNQLSIQVGSVGRPGYSRGPPRPLDR